MEYIWQNESESVENGGKQALWGSNSSFQVYVSGSWDKFSSYEAMEGGRDGRYRAIVAVGDDACAEFQPLIACFIAFPRGSSGF